MCSKDVDSPSGSGVISPVLLSESPGYCTSTCLQGEYPELFWHALGMKDSDTVSMFRCSGPHVPHATLVELTEGDFPYDQQDEWDLPHKTERGDMAGHNTNSSWGKHHPWFNSSDVAAEMDRNVNSGNTDPEDPATELLNSMSPSLSAVIRPFLADFTMKLDIWVGRFKSDILKEFHEIITVAVERQRLSSRRDSSGVSTEKRELERKVNQLSEMVSVCEENLHKKDVVIENMAQALEGQRDKVSLAQAFYHTRAEHAEAQKEKYAEGLARQHHDHQLSQRVLRAWYGLIQDKWRNRVEMLYESKIQDSCRQLSDEYEIKIKLMNEEIESLRTELQNMRQERKLYSRHVKRAFMRGMCALNKEAMSTFTLEEAQISPLGEQNTSSTSNSLEFRPSSDRQLSSRAPEVVSVPDLCSDTAQFTSVQTEPQQEDRAKQSQRKASLSTASNVSLPWHSKTSTPVQHLIHSVTKARHGSPFKKRDLQSTHGENEKVTAGLYLHQRAGKDTDIQTKSSSATGPPGSQLALEYKAVKAHRSSKGRLGHRASSFD